MELHNDLDRFIRAGIQPYAISYDSVDVLRKFAERYGITYPLLSDEGSQVIREFGILNTHMPDDHGWFGIPYPGSYMIGEDGRVFEKSFIADHGIRRTVSDILHESFKLDGGGDVHVATTDHLTARAYFPSNTMRRAQRMTLSVEIELAEGLHVYGRPLPGGYIPVDVSLGDCDKVEIEQVRYPEAEPLRFEVIDETLPAYHGAVLIRADCRAVNTDQEGPFTVPVKLRYQACDDRECYLPQTVDIKIPMEFLPHDWERV